MSGGKENEARGATATASAEEEATNQEVETLLAAERVSFAFEPGRPLLDGVSFAVKRGEFVSLLAPSGAGKSTLFRLIAGLLEPQGGSLTLAGPSAAGGRTSRLGRVGYMPQKDCLLPWRRVLDNAALGLELAGVPRREARQRASALLPSFGLAGTEAKYPHELSGGMRQRVSFLRTVLCGAELLLLDEPFSALDAMTRVDMQEWLLGVWERHRSAVVFITHDVDEALLLSDRVLVATSAPVRELREVRVDLPRPRSYRDTTEERFAALKRRVLELLRPGGEGGDPA